MDHHVDIMLREAKISRELHRRLFAAVHYVINQDIELAVSWPDWKNTPGEFGLLFRVFGKPDALSKYIAAIEALQSADLVRVYPPMPTPTVDKTVVYSRDRSMDKFAPSRTVRAEKREAVSGKPSVQKNTRPTTKPHFLQMRSKNTNQEFNMFITRKSSSSMGTNGMRYGLGYVLPDF